MSALPRPPHSDRAVPLPHGTEVIIGAERVVAGRRVPRGAVGRVVRGDDALPGQVSVMIVGVGVGVYPREDLLPRKEGQARFARRRTRDWDALLGCRILEATVGSRAWGVSDESSDEDKRGIFALPFSWGTGLSDAPTDLIAADSSAIYWEVGKAIRQGLRADPNTLELLFVGSVRPLDELGQWVLEAREAFVSSQIYGSFGQYALAQLRRLIQSQRLMQHRTLVFDWLRETPIPSLDQLAERLASLEPVQPSVERAKQHIKQLYRSLYDQGLLLSRDFEALVDLARNGGSELELPRELRPKNAYNLVRLVHTATRWLSTGAPELEVRGAMRDRLLAIKRGQVPLDAVLAEVEGMTPALEAAHASTRLPPRPDLARAHRLLQRIEEEVARRHIRQSPGPLGVDAPEPPEVVP